MCLSVLDTFFTTKLWFGTGRWGGTDKRRGYNTLALFILSFNYHDRKDSDDFFFFQCFYHVHSVMAEMVMTMMMLPYPGIRDGMRITTLGYDS